HRRRPRRDDRRSPGAVVQLQAALAVHGRGAGAPRRARGARRRRRRRRRERRRGHEPREPGRAGPGRLMRRVVGRVRVRLLAAASWLACRLPERPLLALADLAGDLTYRLASERRARARRNLTRIARWL